MVAFLLCILTAVITGGGFANARYFGVPVIYVILGTLLFSYMVYFITKREAISMGSAEKSLLIFETWGLLYVLLSLTGIIRFTQLDLAYDLSFVPRQAVYYFVLPAAILFREDLYFRGAERFLKKYGEILFWVLYFCQFLNFGQIMMSVITQAFLGWLALYLDTNQRWRRWARIAVLLVTPMIDSGGSTILIIRLVFFAVCIIPKAWSRVALRLMALVLLVAIIACFIIPVTVGDTIFSDWNMAWRARTWKDSEMILADSSYVGVGYGTSYQSESYVNASFQRGEWQYRAGEGYTEEQRKFVTGPHNSFISVAMRTGIVGIVLFLSFLIILFINMTKHRIMASKASCFALFAGIIMIMFNVGLESPSYLLPFVFCIGVSMREEKRLKNESRALQENYEVA